MDKAKLAAKIYTDAMEIIKALGFEVKQLPALVPLTEETRPQDVDTGNNTEKPSRNYSQVVSNRETP